MGEWVSGSFIVSDWILLSQLRALRACLIWVISKMLNWANFTMFPKWFFCAKRSNNKLEFRMFGSIWFCTKSDFWKNYQRSAEFFGRPYGFGNGCCCFNFGQITAIHWQECWCSLTVSYYYHFPFLFSFLADQNSSIGDLVTDSLRVLLLLTYKEWPWRLVTFEWWENMTWSTFWQFRIFYNFLYFLHF